MTIKDATSFRKAILENKFLSLTIIFIFFYTLAAIIVSVLRYYQFDIWYFDFGVNDQAIWQVSRLHIPITYHPNYINVGGFNIHLADHFSPSIYLLSPLYWLTSKQEIILIAQSVVVGISALAGVILAKKFIKNDFIIFALIISYLGFVGMQNALITEFHEATLSPLPIMIAFLAIISRRWKIFYICLFIILGLKETFAGLGVGLGLFILLFDRKNWKHAFFTIAICGIWAITITKFVIPFLSKRAYFYAPGNSFESFIALIQAFMHFDVRLKTLFWSFLSFGFLPLFYIPLIPAVSENFLSRFLADGASRFTLAMHYSAPLAAVMFFSSVMVFSKIERSKRLKTLAIPYAIFMILNTVFLHHFELKGPLALAYNPAFYRQLESNKYKEDFMKNIPRDKGLIMAQNDFAGKFAHQKVMMLDEVPHNFNPGVIVINLTPGQNPNNFFPLDLDRTTRLKDRLLQNPNYEIKKYGDELYVFVRKNTQKN